MDVREKLVELLDNLGVYDDWYANTDIAERRMIMRNCGNCANYDRVKMEHTDVCGGCVTAYVGDVRQEPSRWKPMPQTNADRIRAMSDEELAEDYCKTLLKVMQYFGIKNTGILEDAVRARLEWLKQSAEE